MKKVSTYLLALMGLAACEPPRDLTYTGATVVEFKNDRVNTATATFLTNNTFNSRTVRQALVTRDSVLVQLVGPHRTQETVVDYTVASNSTAIEGTHFSFLSTKGKVTIPANSSSAFVKVRVLQGIPASVSATQDFRLVLTLSGNTDTQPSENYKTFTLNIRR